MSSYFKLGMDKKLVVPYADYLKAMKPDFEYVGNKEDVIDVVRCLNLPSANSVKIVGARGAGSTALMDALAFYQHADFMPDNFMIRGLFKFNANNLFNTSDGKAVETRFQTALEELQRNADQRQIKPVLLIDDGCNFICNAPQHVINCFVEAAITADYLDAVIAVDRKKEAEFNAKHPEFVQSFTTKELKEPEPEQILRILQARAKMHAKSGIIIEDDSLEYLIGITQRFKIMYDTAQPNRSIRLLDSAVTSFHMDVHSMAPGAYEKKEQLKNLDLRIKQNNLPPEEAESLQSQAETLRIELKTAEEEWKEHREKIKVQQDEIREFDVLIAGAQKEIDDLDAQTRKLNYDIIRKHVEAVPDGHKDLKGRSKEELLRLDEQSLLNFAEFDLNVERNPTVGSLESKITSYNTAVHRKQQELAKLGENLHKDIVMPPSEIEKSASIEAKTPVGGVSGRLKENLRNGMTLMKETVYGQDHVLEPIVASLRRAAAGLNDPDRPLGNFIVAGPPGVGKSWIGKQIAVQLFGSEDFFEVVDMEKYQEKHTVSSLLGAPPGYAGYGTLGKLIEIGQTKPFCVLLLDEIEKAHPDVRQALLKVKGSGRLVGFDGEEADFRNIIIVETTNYGQKIWIDNDFATAEKLFHAQIRQDTAVFSPEYLDRADAILCAGPLDEKALGQIVRREVGKLRKKVAKRNDALCIDVSDEDLSLFVSHQCMGVSGRRSEMMINKIVGDPLTNLLLSDTPARGTLKGHYNPAHKAFTFDFLPDNAQPDPRSAFGKLTVK